MTSKAERFRNFQGGIVVDTTTGRPVVTISVENMSIQDAADVLATVMDALEARFPREGKGE